MMKTTFRINSWLLLLVAGLLYNLLLTGCKTDSDQNPIIDVFKIEGDSYKVDEVATIRVEEAGDENYMVKIGGGIISSGGSGPLLLQDPYEGIGWSIVESPGTLPAGLTIVFNPVQCSDLEDHSTMTIHAHPAVPDGTYEVTLKTTQTSFLNPKTLKLKIIVSIGAPPPPLVPVWKDVTPASGLKPLNSVAFADAYNGFAVGDLGTILRTVDGGKTWSTSSLGTTKDLRAITFVDNGYGFIVGKDIFLKTTDGGLHWMEPSPGITGDFRGLHAIDSITVFIHEGALSSKVMVTRNKGLLFQTVGNFGSVTKIFFTSSMVGFMISGVSGLYTYLYRTTDGGASWSNDATRYEPGMIDMHYGGFGSLYACGYGASVYRSANSGVSWDTDQIAGVSDNFYAISFAGADGIAVGSGGTVARTNGFSWQYESSGVGYYLFGVAALNDSSAVAVGNGLRPGSTGYEGVIMKRK